MSVHPIGPRAYDPGYLPNASKTNSPNVRPAKDLSLALSQEETSALDQAFGPKAVSSNKPVTVPGKSLGQNIDISA